MAPLAGGKPRSFSMSGTRQKARLVVVADKERSELRHLKELPKDVEVVGIGTKFPQGSLDEVECMLLNSVGVSREEVREVFAQNSLPSLKWLHSNMAGLDVIKIPEIMDRDLTITNSKGTYSRSLAEYVLFSAKFFALQTPRLLNQKASARWEKFPVGELAGKTMGIIGFGDIGRATGVLAKAYGMRVLATRRNPELSRGDKAVDKIFCTADLELMVQECDYVVCSTPLVPSTKHIVNASVLSKMKRTAVFINVGRGQCVDERALCSALKSGAIMGAGLDVFETEPLPQDSELWGMPNVLISPHNADQVDGWLDNSIHLFVKNMSNYLEQGSEGLLNVVDIHRGY
ncbi:2-hydroxyacid dehydrogenase [Chloropicon primus]|uniref:2-hydroxyacid dehydrogenase n=1 Tax=Chloropicon primus TaxID=1764295 RepID=A0A5B8MEE2_9CHLO|nr:2-hydroxyacid dehydrogenase [Chloropicon primus]UPQ98006.1 2-hydroxyacid dehydrogenase [Chloropicon primus]|eukprot:QDZ18799.1 2-hydroxyacid dehydrogenase [Chloropicon primus]